MDIFKFCKKYLLNNKYFICINIFLTLCAVLISILIPFLVGGFFDYLTINNTGDKIFYFCGAFILLNIISIFIGYLSTIIYSKVQLKMSYNLTKDIVHHIQSLSISYTDNINSSYLTQRVNSDSNEIIKFCLSTLQNILGNIMIFIITFSIMLSINIKITLFLIFFFCLYILLYFVSKNALYNSNYKLKEKKDGFFSNIHDQIKYTKLIKLNSIAIDLNDKFNDFLYSFINYQKIKYVVYGLDGAIQLCAQIMLFALGGYEIINGNFTIGMFTMFSSYFNKILNAGSYFFNLASSYQVALVSKNRLSDILKNKKELMGNSILNEEPKKIEINDINISINNKLILPENFSASFNKGNIYAITGSNGAGKSTIINLIMGMYIDEKIGQIKYNGKNIEDLNMNEIRKNYLALSEQEPILLGDTIKDNITFSKEEIDTDKLLKYINILGIDYFKDINLFLEKDINLSGGEKQKISILRVLYKDSSIMIFDEPTSALDLKSVKLFINYLKQIKENKIIIIVTHNLIIKEEADIVININR